MLEPEQCAALRGADITDIENPFFLVGLLSEFNNRFQTRGDAFFEEISWRQCFLLICMNLLGEPPTIRQLADLSGSSHQNVKQLLLRLEKAGFVELKPDTEDRRKMRIFKTEKAREFEKAHDQPSAAFMQQLFAGVSPEALETTIKTILQLDQNLENL